MDLPTAFNSVNSSKPWRVMLDMGLDVVLVHFLQSLHKHLGAKLQFGQDGELSEAFCLERGVRQGCEMAPLWFF